MQVLLIDNYDSFTFNLAQLLNESNLCEFTIIKNDDVNLNEIFEFTKVKGILDKTKNYFHRFVELIFY